jgi:hypothetical protein
MTDDGMKSVTYLASSLTCFGDGDGWGRDVVVSLGRRG